ncbi:MAG: AraC family transcriptional regulator [Proteobacteria bacterium]|nr:AraC family transcriptional regulator [Pseudomonadota bacterium]
MDWLSRLLDLVSVQGQLDIRCTFGAPWRVDHAAAAAGEIQYHVITEGGLTLEDPAAGPPQHLKAGDVLILPDGRAHLLHDGSGGVVAPVRRRAGVNVLIHENSGPGERLDMLCGRFLLSVSHIQLLRNYLPPRIVIRRDDIDNGAHGAQMSTLIELMRREVAAESLGGRALLNALSAALFTVSLRCAGEVVVGPPGLLTLAKHQRLAPALTAIFNRPAHSWTLPELANICRMSRATFARHFQESLGRSAAELLMDVRMTLAANELRKPGVSTAMAAGLAGYQSEAAFQRVFKQHMGVTPAQWRRNQLAGLPVSPPTNSALLAI